MALLLNTVTDFNEANLPRADLDTTPVITWKKVTFKRTVLVLDISGSMEGDRLTRLGQVNMLK